MSPLAPDIIYEAGPFSIDTARRVVTRCGEPIHVQHRDFDLLLALVSNRHRIVDRNELLDMVWGADEHVISANVDQHVYLLRKAFGDDSKAPRFIATFGRRGYRFIHDAVEKRRTSPPGDTAGSGLADKSAAPVGAYRAGDSPASIAGAAETAMRVVLRNEIVVQQNSDLGRLIVAAASLPAPLQKAAVDFVVQLRAD